MCEKCIKNVDAVEENEDAFRCVVCGENLSEDEVYVFNENCYCEDCLDDETFVCECCGERFFNSENDGDDNINLCTSCYDRHYTTCDSCERIISFDCAYYLENEYGDEDTYCQSCYEREKSCKYIHDYSYKPDPIFRGNGKRYFGVELEVDEGGKSEENALKVLSVANEDCENIYIKTDGSLEDGFEIVTHPMTLEYHTKNMPWKGIVKKALNLGYRSHNTSTSGLHIHINRNSLGESVEVQDRVVARILYFFENNWSELLRFSRRTNEQLNRWAKRYGWKEAPMEILDDAKKRCGGRYSCVNITNYSTIEVRIFRGTLKYNTIIATLQLVDAICDVALFMSDEDIKNLGWSSFVMGLDSGKYTELIRYLKERRLYVNEPVENVDESEEF